MPKPRWDFLPKLSKKTRTFTVSRSSKCTKGVKKDFLLSQKKMQDEDCQIIVPSEEKKTQDKLEALKSKALIFSYSDKRIPENLRKKYADEYAANYLFDFIDLEKPTWNVETFLQKHLRPDSRITTTITMTVTTTIKKRRGAVRRFH